MFRPKTRPPFAYFKNADIIAAMQVETNSRRFAAMPRKTPPGSAAPSPAGAPPVWTRSYMREWRESVGLPRKAIAKFARPGADGFSDTQLYRVEVGRAEWKQGVLEAYARACGCTITDLLTRPPHMPDAESERLQAIWQQVRNAFGQGEGESHGP